MKKLLFLPLAGLAVLAACSEGPTILDADLDGPTELVITPGIPAPAKPMMPSKPLFSDLKDATLSVNGSHTTLLYVNGSTCTDHPDTHVKITYTVSGNQRSEASFKVNTKWDYEDGVFKGSEEETIVLPRKQGGGDATVSVTLTVTNSSGEGSGFTNFVVEPFGLETNQNDPPGQQLKIDASSTAIVNVAFVDCNPAPTNTPPTLTLPADMTFEATSSNGAKVEFLVSATDAEDGDLTDSVVCKVGDEVVNSGDTFALGEHTVHCSVTDSGGLSVEGSFIVRVQDTTPAYFTSFPEDQTLIAADINGAVLDLMTLGIAVADWNNVSEPSTWDCKYDGETLAIGSTTTIECTATDAIGNESEPSYFDVFVTLDLSDISGFLKPLRMEAPYSKHKAGSAIPHKFPAPKYADGTPATDLADGLRLVLVQTPAASKEYIQEDGTEFAAGSTVWRYDAKEGHYIFNLKTEKKMEHGDWKTTVSFAGITLATTTFNINK